MLKILVSTALVLIYPCTSWGQDIAKAGAISDMCKLVDNDVTSGTGGSVCLGFLAGFAGYHSLTTTIGDTKGLTLCIPEGETVEDMRVIFMRYMENHPEYIDTYAELPLALALKEAYCPE